MPEQGQRQGLTGLHPWWDTDSCSTRKVRTLGEHCGTREFNPCHRAQALMWVRSPSQSHREGGDAAVCLREWRVISKSWDAIRTVWSQVSALALL